MVLLFALPAPSEIIKHFPSPSFFQGDYVAHKLPAGPYDVRMPWIYCVVGVFVPNSDYASFCSYRDAAQVLQIWWRNLLDALKAVILAG